jgi:hypothetical protein
VTIVLEAADFSETSVHFYHATRRRILEDNSFDCQYFENLKALDLSPALILSHLCCFIGNFRKNMQQEVRCVCDKRYP